MRSDPIPPWYDADCACDACKRITDAQPDPEPTIPHKMSCGHWGEQPCNCSWEPAPELDDDFEALVVECARLRGLLVRCLPVVDIATAKMGGLDRLYADILNEIYPGGRE